MLEHKILENSSTLSYLPTFALKNLSKIQNPQQKKS